MDFALDGLETRRNDLNPTQNRRYETKRKPTRFKQAQAIQSFEHETAPWCFNFGLAIDGTLGSSLEIGGR